MTDFMSSSVSLINKSILASSLLCLAAAVVVHYEYGLLGVYGIIGGFSLAIGNFVVSAFSIQRCINRKKNPMATIILPGFLIRLPLMLGIIYYFIKTSWVNVYVFIGSFIAVYSTLLFVELKIVNDLAKSYEIKT